MCGSRPARENVPIEHEARTRGPRAQNTRSGRPNTRSGARGLSAMEGDLDADDDADVNFSCTSRPDAAQRSGLRARQAWSGGPAVSSSHLRSWAVNHPVPPLHRPCACLCPSQAYSPAQRARIIDPGPGRRPPGRRFALHRASGPRLHQETDCCGRQSSCQGGGSSGGDGRSVCAGAAAGVAARAAGGGRSRLDGWS